MRQLGMLQITPSTCSYNFDPVFSNRNHLLFSTGLEIGVQRDKERQQRKELFHTCSALSKETAASFHCSHTSLSESMASSYFWFATLSANRLSLWKTQQRENKTCMNLKVAITRHIQWYQNTCCICISNWIISQLVLGSTKWWYESASRFPPELSLKKMGYPLTCKLGSFNFFLLRYSWHI